jgi:hypothetical protein
MQNLSSCRFSRFQEFAVNADPEDNARDILDRGQEDHTSRIKALEKSDAAGARS